jgi:two-component system chemotaxis response regulator CheB
VIGVLVVDDSVALRQGLKLILESDPELRVIGEATDGEEAIAMAAALKPDVITMDIGMPRMNGLDATRQIMAENPVPVVMVTSVDLEREGIAAQAAELGVVSIIRRPARVGDPGYETFTTNLIEQVKLMSGVKVVHRSRNEEKTLPATRYSKPAARWGKVGQPRIIAIAASTGGPAALHTILGGLPSDFRLPILVVQHISFGLAEGLVGWLDAASDVQVKVAEHGESVQPGIVYVASDDHHLRMDAYDEISLIQTEHVSGHRPSATVLFESVARTYGTAAIGLILTGMGPDGALGLRALREAGATTMAQDEGSCVVFGMPKEAIALGAVEYVVPLEKMARIMVMLAEASPEKREKVAL